MPTRTGTLSARRFTATHGTSRTSGKGIGSWRTERLVTGTMAGNPVPGIDTQGAAAAGEKRGLAEPAGRVQHRQAVLCQRAQGLKLLALHISLGRVRHPHLVRKQPRQADGRRLRPGRRFAPVSPYAPGAFPDSSLMASPSSCAASLSRCLSIGRAPVQQRPHSTPVRRVPQFRGMRPSTSETGCRDGPGAAGMLRMDAHDAGDAKGMCVSVRNKSLT